jgi:hypothetical protein
MIMNLSDVIVLGKYATSGEFVFHRRLRIFFTNLNLCYDIFT